MPGLPETTYRITFHHDLYAGVVIPGTTQEFERGEEVQVSQETRDAIYEAFEEDRFPSDITINHFDIESSETFFPEGFPFKDTLNEQGVHSVEDWEALNDPESLDKIGGKRVQKIEDAIENVKSNS